MTKDEKILHFSNRDRTPCCLFCQLKKRPHLKICDFFCDFEGRDADNYCDRTTLHFILFFQFMNHICLKIMDGCYALYFRVNQSPLKCPDLVQNATACLLTGICKSERISPILVYLS